MQQQQQQQEQIAQARVLQDRAARKRRMGLQKEKFLNFTRVLIKYLEQKDPQLHQEAKNIIKECVERNKCGEPGYESVTAAMRLQLKILVGEQYWKRAEAYLKHFMDNKAREQRNRTRG